MISIDEARCTGCGLCVEDCISRVISLKQGKAQIQGSCLQCGHCVAICPHQAPSIPNYSDVSIAADQSRYNITTESMLAAIKLRRSIRSYKQQPISYDHLHKLMDAAAHTPTAKNTQACRFVFIQDSLNYFKEMVWNCLRASSNAHEPLPIPEETLSSFFALKEGDTPQDFLFRNAPAVLCIQAPDPVDAGLAASAIEMVGSTLGIGVLYNGYLRRCISFYEEVQQYLDMDLEEKPLIVCMLVGYSNVEYQRSAPRRNPSVVLR